MWRRAFQAKTRSVVEREHFWETRRLQFFVLTEVGCSVSLDNAVLWAHKTDILQVH